MRHQLSYASVMARRILLAVTLLVACCQVSSVAAPQVGQPGGRSTPARDQWGAPLVHVSHREGEWKIVGKRNRLTLRESDLSIHVQAGPVAWDMVASQPDDMLVKWQGELFQVRLADAGRTKITPYATGFKTGVKIRLEQFRSTGLASRGLEMDLALSLTVCLEGAAEELVCDVTPIERDATIERLDWPKQLDTQTVDYSVLSHVRGNLLPRDWPRAYHPF